MRSIDIKTTRKLRRFVFRIWLGTSPSCSSTPPPAFDDISEHGSSSHRHSSDDKTGSSSGIGSGTSGGIGGGHGGGIGGGHSDSGGGGSVDRRSTSCRSDNYKEDSIRYVLRGARWSLFSFCVHFALIQSVRDERLSFCCIIAVPHLPPFHRAPSSPWVKISSKLQPRRKWALSSKSDLKKKFWSKKKKDLYY